MRVQPVFGDKVRYDSRRHEMGADRDMRIDFVDKFYQRSGIQPIEHESHAIGFPWFIALFVPPAEKVGSSLYQTGIKLRIEIAEQLISKMQGIAVNHLAHPGIASESFGQR